MTLASGADVAIGGIDYVLAREVDGHYVHRYESLFAQATAIAGEIAKSQLRPEKMLWAHTDWSGGEGARIYYPNDPTRYDVSTGLNVTQRGLVTSRTRRYRSAVARSGSSANTSMRPAVGSAYNKAIVAWSNNIIYSRNAVGWTATTMTATPTSDSYYDMDTDGRFALPGILVEGSSDNYVLAFDATQTAPTDSDLFTGSTAINAPFVSEVIDGTWYTWGLNASGVLTLYKGAGLATTSAGTLIYTASMVPVGAWGSDFYTDLEAAETSLFMSLGSRAGSFVWETRADVGRPFYTTPPGFVIKKMVYHLGVLFLLGSQMASGKQFGALFAIPLSSRSPVFLASPRRHQNEEVQEFTVGCPGHGASIFLGDAHSGKVFTYDMDTEALALFDDLSNGTGDGTSYTPWTNMLPLSTATLEVIAAGGGLGTTSLAGWTAGTQTSVALTTAANTFRDGKTALAITKTSGSGTGSATTATGLNGISVEPDTEYTAFAYFRAAVTTRTATVSIVWYDSTGATISTSAGAGASSTSAGFTQSTVTATSPSTAAYAAAVVSVASMALGEVQYVDSASLHPGSSTATQSQIAGLAMHGSRLIAPTWEPAGVDTSLQVITWDDLQRENRDASQAISASLTSAEWDYGVPQEIKILTAIYVNYEVTDPNTASGLVDDSRITISYATDGGDFVDLDPIDADTEVLQQGRVVIQVSDGDDSVKFTRLRLKYTLDNNSQTDTAPPILFGVTVEAQLAADSRVWDLVLITENEAQHDRPSSRQVKGVDLRNNLRTLKENRALVTLQDGTISDEPGEYEEVVVQVEDLIDIVDTENQGVCRVRLRAVPV